MCRLIVIALGLVLLVGCSQKIYYKMDGVSRIDVPDLKDLSISISPPKDTRREGSFKRQEIFDPIEDNRNDCYNLEKGYKNVVPSSSIASLLVEHLRSAGIFRKVYLNTPDSADLSLECELTSFAGHCAVDESARNTQAVGAQFGLIGALVAGAATANKQSEFEFEIRYANILVRDKSKSGVCEIPEYKTRAMKKIPVVTNCVVVYGIMNTELKTHNQEFISMLTNRLVSAGVARESRKGAFE